MKPTAPDSAPSGQAGRRISGCLSSAFSFSEAFRPYFSWGFGKVVRAIRGGYGDLPERIIEEEKPDVVVIEMAESYL
jgi:hypothetical protein